MNMVDVFGAPSTTDEVLSGVNLQVNESSSPVSLEGFLALRSPFFTNLVDECLNLRGMQMMEDESSRCRNVGVGGSRRSGRRDRCQILRELPSRPGRGGLRGDQRRERRRARLCARSEQR
jgi:hypothetical protein